MMLLGGGVALVGAALLIAYAAMVIVAFVEVCLPSADPQHPDTPEPRNAELVTGAFSHVAVAREMSGRTGSPGQ